MAPRARRLPTLTWREDDPFSAEPPSVRSRADPAAWGDVVLARKEVPASYHLAVVVDDAFQEVTDVVRGKDLEAATAVHRLLQTLLGLPEPRYFHHRLILDGSGEKLSKSRGSETIRARRAAGETLEDSLPGSACGSWTFLERHSRASEAEIREPSIRLSRVLGSRCARPRMTVSRIYARASAAGA